MSNIDDVDGGEHEEEWIPTPDEKKQAVIYLHSKKKSYREIARVVHISFSDISRIIREKYGYEVPKKDYTQLSDETKALKLFEENKQPIEVAIDLDIPTDDAVSYYQKFQELKCLPLHDKRIKLQNEIQALESAKQNADSQLIYLKNQLSEISNTLQYYKQECEQTRNEMIVLQCQRRQLVGW
jgi:hypothetical protein